ncbi:hypothetical protein NVS89_18205 [Ancylobacter sp. MQZ15Z-1]|uniref:Uncharacterized protein n=1 Tax=Ancylobacter mangrovi TaxID=2972472 RepID=A0A9X2PE10_9HYPH|nr:hypothetical protein [Ancylobacter mangrovi]MCS0497022.1 hypothetical protein [Ancylobacter mangrovi]
MNWFGYIIAYLIGGVSGCLTVGLFCGASKIELMNELERLRARQEPAE